MGRHLRVFHARADRAGLRTHAHDLRAGRRLKRALVVFAAGKAIAVAALLAGIVFYFTPLHPWNRDAGLLLASSTGTRHYGDPLAGLAAQKVFVFNNDISNLVDLRRFVDFLLEPPRRFLDTNNSGLDKAMMAVSLGALALGARRSADPFLLATWICLAVLPAMMGEGGSYARHALLAWPCFVLTAGPALDPRLKWALVLLGFALQAYLAFCFGGNRWVG